MPFWIFLFLCVSAVSCSREPSSGCRNNVTTCRSTETTVSLRATGQTRSSLRRSTAGWKNEEKVTGSTPPARNVKKQEQRKRQTKRRLSRKKVHRHSTRVLNLKPAVILLPPFESTNSTENKLDPFIINVISTSTTTEPVAKTKHKPTKSRRIRPPSNYLLPPIAEPNGNFIDEPSSSITVPEISQTSPYSEGTTPSTNDNYQKTSQSSSQSIIDFTQNLDPISNEYHLSSPTPYSVSSLSSQNIEAPSSVNILPVSEHAQRSSPWNTAQTQEFQSSSSSYSETTPAPVSSYYPGSSTSNNYQSPVTNHVYDFTRSNYQPRYSPTSYQPPTPTVDYTPTSNDFTHQSTLQLNSSENPFIKLEKEYRDIQKIVEINFQKDDNNNHTFVEASTPPSSNYGNSPVSSNYENSPISTNLENSPISSNYENSPIQEGWSPSPTAAYNPSLPTERWNASFFEERSIKNDYGRTHHSYDVLNNSLLAPDVASLGMKIVTSKKGMEMLKEFIVHNNTGFPNEPQQKPKSFKLETAETGDFRLQNYDNQILTYDDSREVPKEAVKVLQKKPRPLNICSGREGYVTDAASGCQVFYICLGRGSGEPMMCPNGTLFNMDFLVCDWWYNVECS